MTSKELLKKFTDRVKAKGLDLTEEMAVVVVDATFDWMVQDVAPSTENKIDDIVAPLVLANLKPVIMGLVDKIDGQDDASR